MTQIRQLSPELLKIAKKELNEVPEKTPVFIETVNEWLKANPHLKIRSDSQFILSFLRGCKFNLDKVKQKLELFYSVRQKSPELIKNRDPNNEQIIGMIRQG